MSRDLGRPPVQSRQPARASQGPQGRGGDQVASGPVPAFLPSSLPQGLLETRRNHWREPQARREPWGLRELALCQWDKSLNFPETWCPRQCGSAVALAVAVRTRGQCERLGRTAGQAAGAHHTAAVGGASESKEAQRPCSRLPPPLLLQPFSPAGSAAGGLEGAWDVWLLPRRVHAVFTTRLPSRQHTHPTSSLPGPLKFSL